MSKTNAGCISGHPTVEISPVTSLCDPGDYITVDKGLMSRTLAPFHITVNIPTFFRKKNRVN